MSQIHLFFSSDAWIMFLYSLIIDLNSFFLLPRCCLDFLIHLKYLMPDVGHLTLFHMKFDENFCVLVNNCSYIAISTNVQWP